jgi:hypothetical protein
MAVETLPFLSAVERMVRAAGRRVAEADEFELAELIHLRDVVDEAIQTAVDGQLEMGRSWSDIAVATGKSRQAAFKRWGRKEKAA